MMDTLATIPEEGAMLIKQALSFPVDVQGVRINTPEEAQAATDQCREMMHLDKRIEAYRKSITDPKRAEIEAIMDTFRPAKEFIGKVVSVLKDGITTFDQEQRRIAAEAEKERQRLQQVERDRQAEEQRRAESLLAQAEKAALAGEIEIAESLEREAVMAQETATAIAVPATFALEKPRGAAMRKIWKARVINAALVPEQFKIVNEKALDAYAKSMKEAASLPGVEFYAEDSLAVR